VQASREWSPPGGTLGEILERTRERVASLDKARPVSGGTVELKEVGPRPYAEQPSLRLALYSRPDVGVIAEIKRRSPSKGLLSADLDAGLQAEAFERGGAAAISVLTEPHFFGGSLEDIQAVAAATKLPILRKDFHISVSQLGESYEAQASSILLIARALPPQELATLIHMAKEAHLDAVVEVRTERELERALEFRARIIGVNSRNLETLEVDERIPERLVPMIPPHVIAIWESGVESADDVRRAAAAGADAVLVGSVLSRSDDPEALVRSLTGVPRRPRRG